MATVDFELDTDVKGASLLIKLVAFAVFAFLIWAKFAWIDEIVRAEGEVISSARPQIVQNLEGGILSEILVSEGDIVEKGQVLARLRSTQFATSAKELGDRIIAADVRRARLEAEMAGEAILDIDAEAETKRPDIVASERSLLAARQADYNSKLNGAMTVMRETERELASMEDLYKRDIVSMFELTEARKAHSDATNRYNEIVTGTELKRATEYSETLAELASLQQDYQLAQDQLERTVILAPMRGVVNNLAVTTIGGVVRPGQEIFQIIPTDDELYVEAQVKPEHIANVVKGQDATIKLSAYDYTIYGTLKGVVDVISADTFKDERKVGGDPHYRVTLHVDMENLTDRQRGVEIRPGMRAVVELHTGEKTVLHYLTKPLYRAQEALREP